MLFFFSSQASIFPWQICTLTHDTIFSKEKLSFLCQYLQVTQATNQIVMNCADIDIITASFAPHGGDGENICFFFQHHVRCYD